jgi:hypothetical protein
VQLGGAADVVDYTAQEALQIKNVISADEQTLKGNFRDAGKQLSGGGNEIVPTRPDGQPFERVIEVIVNSPQSPLYDLTPRQLATDLGEYFNDPQALQRYRANVDTIRITNQNGVQEFKVIRSRNQEFQRVDPVGTPQPRQVSQIEPALVTPAVAIATTPQAEPSTSRVDVAPSRELDPPVQTASREPSEVGTIPDFAQLQQTYKEYEELVLLALAPGASAMNLDPEILDQGIAYALSKLYPPEERRLIIAAGSNNIPGNRTQAHAYIQQVATWPEQRIQEQPVEIAQLQQ